MEAHYLMVLCLACVILFGAITAQNAIPPSRKRTFYMNKASDCDGKPRSTGSDTVEIYGKTSEIQQSGRVLSCTITIDTEDQREPRRFKLQFLAVTIRDPNVHLHIYDGEYNGRQLHAFSKNNQLSPNLDFDFTSGQRVSFRLVRGEFDTNFDIRIIAIPVPADVKHCAYENEYGCDEYGYKYRVLGTKEIAAIIGGCFALVVVIVIVVIVCCYRKQRGISRKWKEERLGAVNTAASIHSLNGKVNKDREANVSRPWTSESSKAEFASIRRSPKLPRVSVTRHAHNADRDRDKDSAFGSNESFHRQRQPLPTHDRSMPRNGRRDNRDYHDKGYKDRDYRDRDYDRESDRSDRSDRHEKRAYKPPTYREAMKHDRSTSGSEFDATEHSFVQADDDHPQKVFIERVIAPRVKPKKQASPMQQKRVIPPPEEDLTYDSIEPKKSKIAETQKDEAETDESDTSNTDNESSEEDTDSEIDPGPEKADKPDARDEYSKVNKKGRAEGGQPQNQGFMPPQQGFMPPPNVQGQGYPGFFPPGVQQPQPRYGYPMQQYPPYQGQLPPQGPVMQPQQGQGPRQDPYSQANFTVPMGQPGPGQYPQQGPGQRQPHPSKRRDNKQPSSQHPNNPPIYSYLVNRGYHPVDGRHSPVSTSTGATNFSGDRNALIEDSDFSANLDSGVELMKRKT